MYEIVAFWNPAIATIFMTLGSSITHQLIEPESCSNPQKMRPVFWNACLRNCNHVISTNYKSSILPYLFYYKPRLIKIVLHFVQFISKGGLESRAALFFISLPYWKYRWCSGFPWLCFFRPNSLHILFSSASRAHLSQEGLWWTEGSCSVKHHCQDYE